MMRHWQTAVPCLAAAGLLLAWSGSAAAQERLSDKDLEKVLNNLKSDAKKFGGAFKQDLSKSAIRKTNDEKEAKQLADQFPKQIEKLQKNYKSNKKAGELLPAISQSNMRLSGYLQKIAPSAKTTEAWSRVQSGIERIYKAYSFASPA